MIAVLLFFAVSAISAQNERTHAMRVNIGMNANVPTASGVDVKAKGGFRLDLGREYFVNPNARLDLYMASSLAYSYERFEVGSGYNTMTTRHKLIVPVGIGLRLNITNKIGVFLEAGPNASFVFARKSNFETRRLLFGGHSNLGVNIGAFSAMLGTEIAGGSKDITLPGGKGLTDRTAYFTLGMRF